ncbi:MAG: hypothetical protein H7Z19_05875, partial [Chitinophagaceae bacterium]|nr:hypothetical protein [Rubrivivax sp.]
MHTPSLFGPALALAVSLSCLPPASARDHLHGLPASASFSTLVTTPLAVEGLTGDRQNNLYTAGRSPGVGLPCPVWQVALSSVTPVLVGQVPAPSASTQCNPSGIAFGPGGALY